MMDLVEKTTNSFHWADYVVFAAFLMFSLGIGAYYGLIAGRKTKTAKDFLMGGKDMQVFPVAMAIMSSFLSAILILGTPAEVYTRGTMYWMYTFGMIGAVILATLLFVPLLYPLRLTSSYEYLEKRYNSSFAKMTGTIILFATQVLYLGIALYSPSTALEAVTGFPEWATIVIGGVVSMVYTAMGGMKASVWASAFQTFVMAGGVIAVIVQGCIDVGGIDKMWELNSKADRIEFFDFSTDPFQRHSFWSLIVGGTVGWLSTYGVNQASVQRFSAMPSLSKARAVVLLNIPGLLFFMTLCVLSGMSIFAYYSHIGCDPLKAGYVSNSNQLIAYFVMDRLAIPGIPGLFLACLFGGALSSVSASLSALTAVTWQDCLKPLKPFKNMTDVGQTVVTKVLVVIYGGVAIMMAFISANMGGTVLQASLSFTGASGGPLLGLFILGAFFPCANKFGAIIGGIIGLVIPMWISIGAYTLNIVEDNLPTTVDQCAINATATLAPETGILPGDISGLQSVFLISYLWYPSIGMVTVVVVGLLITMVTNCHDPSEIPSKYLIPVFDRVMCCLPDKNLRILRCHRPLPEAEDEGCDVISVDAGFQRNSSKASIEELSVKDLQYVYDNVCLEEINEYKKPADDSMSCDSLPSYHSRDILSDEKTVTSEVTVENGDRSSFETTRI